MESSLSIFASSVFVPSSVSKLSGIRFEVTAPVGVPLLDRISRDSSMPDDVGWLDGASGFRGHSQLDSPDILDVQFVDRVEMSRASISLDVPFSRHQIILSCRKYDY